MAQDYHGKDSPTTREFTDLQFIQSVSYVPRPRRVVRLTVLQWLMFAIALACFAYAGTYFVLSWVLR